MNAIVAAPGARLRGERERQGLSVQKAADEMRLDAWVIEALETDQYERVGPAVYVRGHLKKYASILAIPGDEIVAGYESLRAATPDAPPKAPAVRVMSSPPLVHNLTRGQIVAAGFLLLLVTGVLLWKPWQQRAAAVAPSHASEAQAGIAEGTAGDGQAQQAPPAGGGDAAAVQGAGAEPQPADRTAFGPGESSPPQGSAAPTAAATGAVATGAAAAAAVAAGGSGAAAEGGIVGDSHARIGWRRRGARQFTPELFCRLLGRRARRFGPADLQRQWPREQCQDHCWSRAVARLSGVRERRAARDQSARDRDRAAFPSR